MQSKTLIPNSVTTSSNGNVLNSTSTSDNSHDHDDDEIPQIPHNFDHANEIGLDAEQNPTAGSDNNPPDSFWVSRNKVTDWLDNHTFIERKASVKLVPVSRKFDPTQTRSSQRSVSFSHTPQATIIGFRQKPTHHADGKSKQDDSRRLFKNRSLPGKNYVTQVTEPRSPRVSCIGRVGSMRGRARRTGFWKTVKTAFLSRVRTSKVPKKAR